MFIKIILLLVNNWNIKIIYKKNEIDKFIYNNNQLIVGYKNQKIFLSKKFRGVSSFANMAIFSSVLI